MIMVVLAAGRLANADEDQKKPPPSEIKAVPIRHDLDVGTLYGVIDLPSGAGLFLIVVSIAGSGPTDRDGNQPRLKNDSPKLLGQGIAAQGIAVLRFDRRGIGQSAKIQPKEEDLTI